VTRRGDAGLRTLLSVQILADNNLDTSYLLCVEKLHCALTLSNRQSFARLPPERLGYFLTPAVASVGLADYIQQQTEEGTLGAGVRKFSQT
jgi:hypothetical protein